MHHTDSLEFRTRPAQTREWKGITVIESHAVSRLMRFLLWRKVLFSKSDDFIVRPSW